MRDEKRKTEQDIDKTYRADTDDEITVDAFGRHYRPLEEQLKQIDTQIAEVQGEIDFLRIQYLSSDQTFNEAKDFYSRWPEIAHEEKRKIVENITETTIIGKEDVTIHPAYLPSSSKTMATEQRNLTRVSPFCHLALMTRKPVTRPPGRGYAFGLLPTPSIQLRLP